MGCAKPPRAVPPPQATGDSQCQFGGPVGGGRAGLARGH